MTGSTPLLIDDIDCEILAELQSSHTRTFRTDLDGATCFDLDGKTVRTEPLCGER